MKYLMMTLMCFTVLGFTACDCDDEKNPVAVVETADAGSDVQAGDTGEVSDLGVISDASAETTADDASVGADDASVEAEVNTDAGPESDVTTSDASESDVAE